MSDSLELVHNVVRECETWRAQVNDLRSTVEAWGLHSRSQNAINVLHHARMLESALKSLANGMKYSHPHYERELRMARAREIAKRHAAESAARRAKAETLAGGC